MQIQVIGPNQTQVFTDTGSVFFSYNQPVAAMIKGKYYRTEKKWSVTTSRHINNWLKNVDMREVASRPQEFFDNLK